MEFAPAVINWIDAGWAVYKEGVRDPQYFPPLGDRDAQREWLGAYSAESCHLFRCESCHLFHAKPATYSRGRLPSVGAKRRGMWHCYSEGVVVVNFVKGCPSECCRHKI